jgi:hypothetical protein
MNMGLFDSAADAREELTTYLKGLGTREKDGTVIKAVEQVCDILQAVMIHESSPYPITDFVEDAKGAAHLKKVLSKSQHKAWLALVASIPASEKLELQCPAMKSAAEQVIDQLA